MFYLSPNKCMCAYKVTAYTANNEHRHIIYVKNTSCISSKAWVTKYFNTEGMLTYVYFIPPLSQTKFTFCTLISYQYI